MADEKRTLKPHDRLTRICDRMTDALHADPEYSGDLRCIVFLTIPEDRNGIVLDGYEHDKDAVVDLLIHTRAIMKANGFTMEIIPVPNDASSL
jgi:hypothetical protein